MKNDFFNAALALFIMLMVCFALIHQVNSHPLKVKIRADGTLRLATYNVHYILINKSAGPWSVPGWEKRRTALSTAVQFLDADVIGFQEMESFISGNNGSVNLTLDWLLEMNPFYGATAIGDWQEFPSTQPIFYRKSRLSPMEQGWFFFSDTPDLIYSRTFNGSYPAFASWARFKDKDDGKTFVVYNVHLEFKSTSNRRKSAELIAERLAAQQDLDEPVFLIGDLNAQFGFDAVKILQDTTDLSFRRVPGSSYHFNRGLNLFGAVDQIGYSAKAEPVGRANVIQEKFHGVWPTDHYPVIADFKLF